MEKEHTDEVKFEYNQITENIYIGTNVCCKTHFDNKLLKNGITADISIEGERVDTPFGVEFFLWIPVVDTEPPTQDQLILGVSMLKKSVLLNKKVYVHCRRGHGRAPTVVAAYFISEGYSVEDAIEKIKEKRPVIHLNDPQVSALKTFQDNKQ